MTRRTIDNVAPDVREWQSKYGDTMYSVTAFTTTREVISANKKDRNAAFELQGLLAEIVGTPQEFILEDKGVSDSGWQKYNLRAFGPPEGVWTYSTVTGGQPEVGAVGEGTGNGATDAGTGGGGTRVAPAPTNNIDASIRASVALKAAANFLAGKSESEYRDVIAHARLFDAWLAKKSSGVTPQGSPEETAPAASTVSRDQTGEGAGQGEGPAPSSKTNWQERVKDWPDPSENPI